MKVTLVGLGDTPSPELGPIYMPLSSNVVLSARGVGEVAVGAGRYRVIISKGPEYELIDTEVTAREGERPEVTGRLERSVDSRGFISADLHQHAVPSFDSGVSLADRALSNAAEGVEVLIATDHNVLTDYRPVIAASGLGRSLASIVGTEATTHSVGHFNAFPLAIVRDDPRGGMVDVEGMSPSEIFAFVRKLGEPDVEAFIQTNHPRSGYIGYFDIMKLDPTSGLSADPRFSLEFDGIEVISFGWKDETDSALADWFSLLRRGRRLTTTGASDSHTIVVREVGWPRTYVCTNDDSPARLDAVAFTRALRSGCASVSAGPMVTLRSGTSRMGDLVKSTSGRMNVDVEVQAPRWVTTDRLTLYVDGNVLVTVPITSNATRRLSRTFPIRCKADCFILARVDGDTPLTPVISATDGRAPLPIALTNPIYMDVDGDGLFHGAPR